MTRYELVTILHPDLEIDIDAPIKKIEKIVKDAGGEIAKQDNWGKRKLAYPIKKQEFGVYIYWEVDMPAEGPAVVDKNLNITTEVLRHLLVKYVEAPEQPEVAEEESKDKEEGEEK